ncbi:CopG family transcriptional regulator [Natronomonas sp. F2-12]|jgi:predicted DNA-binding protein|uniref:CopG family transcriptional regulator n=1 Tax=Natronomonas aquatica TaxID=2841590 RepID=A0A9R1CPM1_9EURY|nr:CopG family transcriptional regulator [Natronomonas aquatica]MCQ4332678.1 CopG family transcriptional regulator [Natronomonas aquatica]
MARYCLECDEEMTRRIEELATQYGLTEAEVLEQLVEVGLEEIDPKAVG